MATHVHELVSVGFFSVPIVTFGVFIILAHSSTPRDPLQRHGTTHSRTGGTRDRAGVSQQRRRRCSSRLTAWRAASYSELQLPEEAPERRGRARMTTIVRARVKEGRLEPVEELDLREGREVTLTIVD